MALTGALFTDSQPNKTKMHLGANEQLISPFFSNLVLAIPGCHDMLPKSFTIAHTFAGSALITIVFSTFKCCHRVLIAGNFVAMKQNNTEACWGTEVSRRL